MVRVPARRTMNIPENQTFFKIVPIKGILQKKRSSQIKDNKKP